jgi:hypothetical protein
MRLDEYLKLATTLGRYERKPIGQWICYRVWLDKKRGQISRIHKAYYVNEITSYVFDRENPDGLNWSLIADYAIVDPYVEIAPEYAEIERRKRLSQIYR